MDQYKKQADSIVMRYDRATITKKNRRMGVKRARMSLKEDLKTEVDSLCVLCLEDNFNPLEHGCECLWKEIYIYG